MAKESISATSMIKIPPFDGTPEKWIHWKRNFEGQHDSDYDFILAVDNDEHEALKQGHLDEIEASRKSAMKKLVKQQSALEGQLTQEIDTATSATRRSARLAARQSAATQGGPTDDGSDDSSNDVEDESPPHLTPLFNNCALTLC
jgi:hypothetical protein